MVCCVWFVVFGLLEVGTRMTRMLGNADWCGFFFVSCWGLWVAEVGTRMMRMLGNADWHGFFELWVMSCELQPFDRLRVTEGTQMTRMLGNADWRGFFLLWAVVLRQAQGDRL